MRAPSAAATSGRLSVLGYCDRRRRSDRLGSRPVTHAVHKDFPGVLPSPRYVQRVGMDFDAEPWAARARVAVALVLRVTHGLQPLRQCQRVAVIAARADPVAAGRGVPGGFSPLDGALVGHDRKPNGDRRQFPGRARSPSRSSGRLNCPGARGPRTRIGRAAARPEDRLCSFVFTGVPNRTVTTRGRSRVSHAAMGGGEPERVCVGPLVREQGIASVASCITRSPRPGE